MSKFLRIQTNGFMELRDLDQERDLLDVIHEELDGGFFEIVRCRSLSHKYLMLVDDCGLLKELPINGIASELYGVRIHGCPICGNVLIMCEGIVDGEPDIVGMTEEDTAELIRNLRGLIVIKEVN